MFAVVEISGQQFKVTPTQKLFVPKLGSAEGSKVKFEKVLLVADDKKTTLGTPFVKGAAIEATVLRHVKDEKVLVFRKKKRKGFKVRRGHRQQFTEIEINKI
ncbi:MAG: 50S ribosomal protein L21 [Ignavibacteriales bacterium]|nr:50S ribosomal protein L21 [Ignavibacteriales bacterium]